MKQEKSHKIWNKNNPNNRIEKGDGNVIHHKDGNHDNNDISNLQKMVREEHVSLHHKDKIVPKTTRKKLSKAAMGNTNGKGTKHSKEFKKEISSRMIGNTNGRGNKGKKHSEETKQKMSKAKMGRKLSNKTRQRMSESQRRRQENVS